LLATLSACGWLPEKLTDPTVDWSAGRFFSEAKDEINRGNYQTAIEYLEQLQARYPFGRYAQQAQLELIFAHFKDNEPDQGIAAADRFIRTHPRHPYVDYAYYMKGLINFSREQGALSRLMPADPAKTDTSTALQAFNDFAELVRLYPNSRYAEDARQRMLFLHSNLASYEVNVANYYLQRGAYLAAANRAQYVLENYARTTSVPEALSIMTQAYVKLELDDLAVDTLRVLELNHPDYKDLPMLAAMVNGEEFKKSRSFFSRIGF